jgi:hypothetical protein
VTRLLAVLVDGLRHDYLNQKDAPFLWQLEQQDLSGCVRESFAGQLRPAFLAGLYPNRSGIGHLFCYDPDNSPFRAARYVPAWAADLPRLGPRLRNWVVQRARTLETARGHDASSRYAYAAEIPWSSLPQFAFSEKHAPTNPDVYPSPSLFDLLREARMEWLYIGYPYDNQETDSILASFHSRWRGSERLVFLHFAELDWCGHLGPDSPARRCALRHIDYALSEVYRSMSSAGTPLQVLVFGDHGMAEVYEIVNVLPALAEINPGAGRRYSLFLDSTVARFWFHDAGAREAVEGALQAVRPGRVLDELALERYGLDGAPRELGELFFVVPAGTVLFPNFFQVTTPPRGMHGYLPEEVENWGRVLVRAQGLRGRLPRPVDLVDIFPVMVTLLGLKVPSGCQGRSFLDDAHTTAPETEKH